MLRVVRFLDRQLSRAETVLLMLAGAAVAATVIAITAGALARYVLHTPIGGVIEIVTIYLGPAITFLGISAALRDRAHVSIDFLARRLPERAMRVATVAVYSLSGITFFLIAWRAWERTLRAWRTEEVMFGQRAWPLFLAYGIVAIGTAVLVLRHLITITSAAVGAGEEVPRAEE